MLCRDSDHRGPPPQPPESSHLELSSSGAPPIADTKGSIAERRLRAFMSAVEVSLAVARKQTSPATALEVAIAPTAEVCG